MRGPPPVRVVCQPDRHWRLLEGAIVAAAAACGAGWVAWRLAWSPAVTAAVVAWVALMAAGVHVVRWRSVGSATLEWTGQHWLLDGQPALPQPKMVFGSWFLLSMRCDGRRRRHWLAVDLSRQGAQGHLLRVALQAARPDPGPSVAGTGHG